MGYDLRHQSPERKWRSFYRPTRNDRRADGVADLSEDLGSSVLIALSRLWVLFGQPAPMRVGRSA